MSGPFDKWPATCERFVAFFDIMGFKDRVFRNSHLTVLNDMNKLKTIVTGIDGIGRQQLNEISQTRMENKTLMPGGVRAVSFSDSIVLVSTENSFESALQTIIASALLLGHALKAKIPIKGAIAYGEETADFEKSIHFGKPLIDAYLLGEELAYYGAVLHHSAESFIKNNHEELWRELIDVDRPLLIPYSTPLKKGRAKHHSVNWARTWTRTLAEIESPLSIAKDIYDISSGINRKYVDNTIEVLEAFHSYTKATE